MAADARNTKVQIELTLDELGRISIALDYFVHRTTVGTDYEYCERPDYEKLQQKWDGLYRGAHLAREHGLVRLS